MSASEILAGFEGSLPSIQNSICQRRRKGDINMSFTGICGHRVPSFIKCKKCHRIHSGAVALRLLFDEVLIAGSSDERFRRQPQAEFEAEGEGGNLRHALQL